MTALCAQHCGKTDTSPRLLSIPVRLVKALVALGTDAFFLLERVAEMAGVIVAALEAHRFNRNVLKQQLFCAAQGSIQIPESSRSNAFSACCPFCACLRFGRTTMGNQSCMPVLL